MAPGGGDALPASPMTTWSPPAAPKAVIVALHGFSDYHAAFKEFGSYAAERGVAVVAYDQPGFGDRADRGSWPGTETLVAELNAAIARERDRYPGVPLFVLGESMGAAVAVADLARADAPRVDGLILVAPATWDADELPRGYRTALRVIAALVPPLIVSGRNLDVRASDNLDALKALGADPLYLHDTRIDGIAGLVDLMDEARRRGPDLAQPTLVLRGGRDQIVPPEAQASFVASLGAAPCAVVTYLNGWHLLLRDHQRRKVYDDILAWTASAPLPSRLDRPCNPPPA